MLAIGAISSFLFVGFTTKAATGTVVTTGSVIFTGTLSGYLDTQETTISGAFSTMYSNVYTTFAKTGLNILKGVEYQALVCL